MFAWGHKKVTLKHQPLKQIRIKIRIKPFKGAYSKDTLSLGTIQTGNRKGLGFELRSDFTLQHRYQYRINHRYWLLLTEAIIIEIIFAISLFHETLPIDQPNH